MFIVHAISFLLVGLTAGWLAGHYTRGNGFGLLGNLIVGAAGSMTGGFLLWLIPDFIKELTLATVCAVLCLTIAGYVVPNLRKKRKKRRR